VAEPGMRHRKRDGLVPFQTSRLGDATFSVTNELQTRIRGRGRRRGRERLAANAKRRTPNAKPIDRDGQSNTIPVGWFSYELVSSAPLFQVIHPPNL
jgi:hypothetical protein